MFKRKKAEVPSEPPFQYFKRTKPPSQKLKKLTIVVINGIIIFGLFGGYKALGFKQVETYDNLSEITTFNKTYTARLFSLTLDEKQNISNREFTSNHSAIAPAKILADNVRAATLMSFEEKSIKKINETTFETINVFQLQTSLSDGTTDDVAKMPKSTDQVAIKIVTEKISENQFLVTQPISIQNYLYEDVQDKDKKEAQTKEQNKYKLEGNTISEEQLKAINQQLQLFFKTYSTDYEKASAMVPPQVKLSYLSGGAFKVETLSVISNAVTKDKKNTVITSIKYASRSYVFEKKYKIAFVENSISTFEELQ